MIKAESYDDRFKQMESQIQQLDSKNMQIDLKNDHQDREIQMLKTLMSKIIHIERNTNEVITAAAHEDINNELTMMKKRPARLLPTYLFKYFNQIYIIYLFL